MTAPILATCWPGRVYERATSLMSNAEWVAILGRRDEPTDALEDYCRLLGEALAEKGWGLGLVRLSWADRGWRRALENLQEQVAEQQPRWVLVQYAALAWSRRGFPVGFLYLLRRLRRTGVKVAIVFHDPIPFAGSRLRDVVRRQVQLAVMRHSARIADRVVSTVSPECVPWMQDPRIRPKALLIPVGSNIAPRWKEAAAHPANPPIVAVFGVTEGNKEEASLIAQTVRSAEQELGPLRLLVVGRGATEAKPILRRLLEGSRVDLQVHGILPPGQIGELLAAAEVQLFVRSGISSRRGSAVAGIACGLPLVGFADDETGFPATEAGVRLVPKGKVEALARELVAVLADPELRQALRQRSRDAARKYFSWSAVADKYLRLLRDPAS